MSQTNVSRRAFLESLGGGAILAATSLRRSRAQDASEMTSSWSPPPVPQTNPNILVIMVDQMRLPMWMGGSTQSLSQVLPNIVGRIQNNSYKFGQFFVAATMCTPSRAALLTGLYAPQTGMYLTDVVKPSAPLPELNTAFQTWGRALAKLNPAYRGNVWWFGKWHLSNCSSASPLQKYGFKTSKYPGGPGPKYNPSPNGSPNEGTDGGQFGNLYYANDSDIAGDFIDWLPQSQSTGPWCATVSFVNAHDIAYAPAWLGNYPPPPGPTPSVYFPPPSGSQSGLSLYSNKPSPWNHENLSQLPGKPSVQLAYSQYLNRQYGTVSDWVQFLNQYFWLQNQVDCQVGRVLDALANSQFADNTIIIFLSDHGEYGGSHGMHTKGFAVYDEAIRVPFCIQFPGQSGQVAMNQMCSAVDFFGLICDLGTCGSGQWSTSYPDLASRQSIWSFLYNNTSETRVAPGPVGMPYVLHTCDEEGTNVAYRHITCLRTKHDPSRGVIGAKLAFYASWAPCTTYPDTTLPQGEFYDYSSNPAETGNDYSPGSPSMTQLNYQNILGTWGTPGTGIIGTELNAPLIGQGTDGKPLSQAQAAAQQAYIDCVSGSDACTVSGSRLAGTAL